MFLILLTMFYYHKHCVFPGLLDLFNQISIKLSNVTLFWVHDNYIFSSIFYLMLECECNSFHINTYYYYEYSDDELTLNCSFSITHRKRKCYPGRHFSNLSRVYGLFSCSTSVRSKTSILGGNEKTGILWMHSLKFSFFPQTLFLSTWKVQLLYH